MNATNLIAFCRIQSPTRCIFEAQICERNFKLKFEYLNRILIVIYFKRGIIEWNLISILDVKYDSTDSLNRNKKIDS